MFILIFVLICVILFNQNLINDHFTNYKKIEVVPTSMIYNNLNLNIKNNDTLVLLSTILKNIYPIDKINIRLNSFVNIVNTYSNSLGLIQEHMYNNKKYPNIRFISGICINYATLITEINSKLNKWTDFENKTIGTTSFTSESYNMLLKLKEITNINFNIKIVSYNKTNIISEFNKNSIQGYFIICPHPDKNIQNINKIYPIKFIGLKGIKKEIIKIKYPYLSISKFDITDYNIFNYTPTSLRIKTIIICNKNLSRDSGYKLINTIFKNLIEFKTINSQPAKLQMKEFNPEDIYLSNNYFILHKGVKDFYKHFGLITYNNNPNCVYSIGINNCKLNNLNRYMLL